MSIAASAIQLYTIGCKLQSMRSWRDCLSNAQPHATRQLVALLYSAAGQMTGINRGMRPKFLPVAFREDAFVGQVRLSAAILQAQAWHTLWQRAMFARRWWLSRCIDAVCSSSLLIGLQMLLYSAAPHAAHTPPCLSHLMCHATNVSQELSLLSNAAFKIRLHVALG